MDFRLMEPQEALLFEDAAEDVKIILDTQIGSIDIIGGFLDEKCIVFGIFSAADKDAGEVFAEYLYADREYEEPEYMKQLLQYAKKFFAQKGRRAIRLSVFA